jgi:hypothetical protein
MISLPRRIATVAVFSPNSTAPNGVVAFFATGCARCGQETTT